VGCCLPVFNCFVLIMETFVTVFGLVSLFSVVHDVDYNNAFLNSASFRWLLLVPCGGSDRFTFICAHFAFVTALCSHLRGLSHLFDQFLTICSYFCTVLVYCGSVVEEPTPFSFLGSSIPSSIQIRNVNDSPLPVTLSSIN
jgi:hypothetical protein